MNPLERDPAYLGLWKVTTLHDPDTGDWEYVLVDEEGCWSGGGFGYDSRLEAKEAGDEALNALAEVWGRS